MYIMSDTAKYLTFDPTLCLHLWGVGFFDHEVTTPMFTDPNAMLTVRLYIYMYIV